MGGEVSDAFEAFDRRWPERQGVFEQRTHHRVLELVVMPGRDARALEVGDGGEGLIVICGQHRGKYGHRVVELGGWRWQMMPIAVAHGLSSLLR
jgi:hypothetical protein